MYKLIKPITAGTRSLVALARCNLYKGKPVKALVRNVHASVGRNNAGKITVRHRGGGHKKAYRLIAFKRLINLKSEVIRMEYDPNRNCCLALTRSCDNTCCYVLGIEGLCVGDRIEASAVAIDCVIGNAMMLKHMPVGTKIHNVEFCPGAGGAVCRAAGAFCQVYSKSARAVTLKLCSGRLRLFGAECMATVGVVAGREVASTKLGKAGRSRWLGRRPSVRGVAMNPVDHPHGGGEGKTSGGRHPVTPWGKPTKGKKTRSNGRTDKLMVKPRRAH
ncbi:50S ribosomal subunit protein L2 [Candidatus Hodgkinia cicadicola]|nr:50S ribosomal subunit protein L2 [Candidatus Hodgkinia cicadicola]